MKAGIVAAQADAPKKTHAMERSTQYVQKSPVLYEALVGVPYGFWQDQGTRYIKATYFFSNNMKAAFEVISEMVDAFHQWQVTHNFKGWHTPATVNLSGTVIGISKNISVQKVVTKTIRPKRLKTTTHVSTRLARRLKTSVRVKTKITPRRSKRKAGK